MSPLPAWHRDPVRARPPPLRKCPPSMSSSGGESGTNHMLESVSAITDTSADCFIVPAGLDAYTYASM